jgi:hypothetical protein
MKHLILIVLGLQKTNITDKYIITSTLDVLTVFKSSLLLLTSWLLLNIDSSIELFLDKGIALTLLIIAVYALWKRLRSREQEIVKMNDELLKSKDRKIKELEHKLEDK